MYHFSKKDSKVNNNFFTKRTWNLFFIVNAIVYLAALTMCLTFGLISRKKFFYPIFKRCLATYGRTHLLAEGYFVSVLSILLAIAFPAYGYMLFQRLERAVLSSNIKKRMLSKVRKIFN
jgi:hypothetical protein